jgi:hypothetical protein
MYPEYEKEEYGFAGAMPTPIDHAVAIVAVAQQYPWLVLATAVSGLLCSGLYWGRRFLLHRRPKRTATIDALEIIAMLVWSPVLFVCWWVAVLGDWVMWVMTALIFAAGWFGMKWPLSRRLRFKGHPACSALQLSERVTEH